MIHSEDFTHGGARSCADSAFDHGFLVCRSRCRFAHFASRTCRALSNTEIVENRAGHQRNMSLARLKPHAFALQEASRAGGGFQSERAPTREHDTVNAVSHVQRIE